MCMLSHFSHVWLFATLWTIAHQAPLSQGFSRQEYWSGLPCPPTRDLPNPGIKSASLMSPALAGEFFFYHWHHLGSPNFKLCPHNYLFIIKQRTLQWRNLVNWAITVTSTVKGQADITCTGEDSAAAVLPPRRSRAQPRGNLRQRKLRRQSTGLYVPKYQSQETQRKATGGGKKATKNMIVINWWSVSSGD